METETVEKLLRLPDVLARTGMSRSTLYSQIALGKFMKPVALSERTVAWPESSVSAWIAERIEASK